MTESHPWILRDRIAGGLIGLLVGDALGVPYEFHPPHALPPSGEIEYTPPHGFQRAHDAVPPGTWSDDGAQALVLLDSLLSCGTLDLRHFSDGLVRWATTGFLAVDGHVFDIGLQTRRAIQRLVSGTEPEFAGPDSERDNGNGALMRVLPLALWHRGTDAELVRLAMLQSRPTHGHLRSQITCAQYCLWVRSVLESEDDAWGSAERRLRTVATSLELDTRELDLVLDPDNATMARGSGYVVDSLWSARHAFTTTTSFESCLRSAITLGNDTDTTAAIAGGIAGVHYGLSGIHPRWREGLRGMAVVEPLLQRLLEHCHPMPSASRAAKTSVSHPLRIAEIPVLKGLLGITFCPGKKQTGAISGTWARDLDLDLSAVQRWGASDVITLIEDHEFVELDVSALPQRVRELGIRWHHLPIVDRAAPCARFEAQWAALLPDLIATLSAGGRVLVHCKGGLGRAGTAAACLLLSADSTMSAHAATTTVRGVRRGAIETLCQEAYIERYAGRRNKSYDNG